MDKCQQLDISPSNISMLHFNRILDLFSYPLVEDFNETISLFHFLDGPSKQGFLTRGSFASNAKSILPFTPQWIIQDIFDSMLQADKDNTNQLRLQGEEIGYRSFKEFVLD